MRAFLVTTLLLMAQDWTTRVQPTTKQVVRLEMLAEGQHEPGVCSGVVVNLDPSYLVTAAHCVDHPAAIGFSMTAAGRHAEIVKVNTVLDLAVVRFDAKDEQIIDRKS